MLSAHDLHVRRGRKAVLSGVTLGLEPGEVLGVLGPPLARMSGVQTGGKAGCFDLHQVMRLE